MFLSIGTYLLFTMYALCFGYPQCFWGYLVDYDHWPTHFYKALPLKSLWIKASAKWVNVNVKRQHYRHIQFNANMLTYKTSDCHKTDCHKTRWQSTHSLEDKQISYSIKVLHQIIYFNTCADLAEDAIRMEINLFRDVITLRDQSSHGVTFIFIIFTSRLRGHPSMAAVWPCSFLLGRSLPCLIDCHSVCVVNSKTGTWLSYPWQQINKQEAEQLERFLVMNCLCQSASLCSKHFLWSSVRQWWGGLRQNCTLCQCTAEDSVFLLSNLVNLLSLSVLKEVWANSCERNWIKATGVSDLCLQQCACALRAQMLEVK